MPASIVEAVAFHHSPGRSDLRTFGSLAAVHVANVLEQELSKAEPCGKAPEIDMDYLAAIGIGDRLDTWRAEVAKLLSSQNGD